MIDFAEGEVRELLRREEGLLLEFKSLWDQAPPQRRVLERKAVRDFIAQSVAAFANSDGGVLLLGVEDDGTPSGHGYPEEAIREFLLVPQRRLRPPVEAGAQRIRIEGVELLIFNTPPLSRAVFVQGDGYPCRIGDGIQMESEEAINARKEAYRKVGFEQMLRREASLQDLDLELARSILAKTTRAGRAVEQALEAFGLVQPGPQGPVPVNAALLLFGRPPLARWHPHADIRFFRVAGMERRHGPRRNVSQLERLELPIARLIPEAHRYAAGQIRKSERLYDLFFKEIPEYPEFAWQEALVNAVAHRDYGNQAQGIEVWFFDDRMEVSSPGTLVPPVTLEGLRLRKPLHASRNPLLVRVLVEAGLMREEGEGIPRMYEETEAVLLKPPSFAEQAGGFQVTLYNTPVFEGVGPEWRDFVNALDLKPSQRRMLLLKPDGFANQDYRQLNPELDRDQAYEQIQEMVARGIITSSGKAGKGARYRLAPAVLQDKLWRERRLPQLRRFFADHEVLQNAGYRRLFEVGRYRAVEDLRRLVDEGYLRRTGERRGAQYLPGARLGETPEK